MRIECRDETFVVSFQMIDSFGSLLDRKLVLEVFSPLYIDLVNMYSSELDSG